MFFISSTATLGAVKKLGRENKEKPFPQRTRYIIIDFHHVRSADYSSVEQVPVPAPNLVLLNAHTKMLNSIHP